MDTKKCKRCNIEKQSSEFYRIGNRLDSSCKECRKLVVRQYRDENVDKVREYDRERGKLAHRKERCIVNTRKRRRDPDGYMVAHNAVARALNSGKIERMPCCMCGTTEKVHAHHDDYTKPLEIMWLCVVHHKSRHSFLEQINEDIF